MTTDKVEQNLYGTLAGKVARGLNKKDGNESDGTISAEIWNAFVGKIGMGKTINNSISLERAMNSISTYAVKLASQDPNKTANDLAAEWFADLGVELSSKPVTKSALPLTKGKGSSVSPKQPEQPDNRIEVKVDGQQREIITEFNSQNEQVRETINGEAGSRRVNGILELGMITKEDDGLYHQTFDMAVSSPTDTSSFGVTAKTETELKKKTDELTAFKRLYEKVRNGKANADEKTLFENTMIKYLQNEDEAFQKAAVTGFIYSGSESDNVFDAILNTDNYSLLEQMFYFIGNHDASNGSPWNDYVPLNEHKVEKLYEYIHSDRYITANYGDDNMLSKWVQRGVVLEGQKYPQIAMKFYEEMTNTIRSDSTPIFNKKEVLTMVNNPNNFNSNHSFTTGDVYRLFKNSSGTYTADEFRQVAAKMKRNGGVPADAQAIIDAHLEESAKGQFVVVKKGENFKGIVAEYFVKNNLYPVSLHPNWSHEDKLTAAKHFLTPVLLSQIAKDIGLSPSGGMDQVVSQINSGAIIDFSNFNMDVVKEPKWTGPDSIYYGYSWCGALQSAGKEIISWFE